MSEGNEIVVTNVIGDTVAISVTSVGDRGPIGDPGPSNVLSIGTVTTGASGSSAVVTITGTSPSQVLNLTIPRGDKGDAAVISVGTVATGASGSTASITNSGNSGSAVFNFVIPRGDIGPAGPPNILSVGTVTTGASGSSAALSITGTSPSQVLNLTIPQGDIGPRGDVGPAGPPNVLSVGTVTTGASGSSAVLTITGTSPSQVLNLTIPRGDIGPIGLTGPAGSTGPAGGFDSAQNISAKTANYTLVLGDAGKLITAEATAGTITVTVPANSSQAFATGTHIDVARLGDAGLEVTGAGGVTVNGTPGNKLRAKWSAGTVIKLDTDTWLLVGDLTS